MQAYRWLALFLLGAFQSVVRGAPVLPLEETREIEVDSHSGWMLHIERDGSGVLQYGQGALDNGNFPADTFSFEEVYRKLASEETSMGNFDQDMSVEFRGGGGLHYTTQYWDDLRVARIWMSRAFFHSRFFDKDRMDQLRKSQPFVPDPPPLK